LGPVNYGPGDITVSIAVAQTAGVGDLLGGFNKISTRRVNVVAFLHAHINNLDTTLVGTVFTTYKVAEEN
jgi:hypothetical protein